MCYWKSRELGEAADEVSVARGVVGGKGVNLFGGMWCDVKFIDEIVSYVVKCVRGKLVVFYIYKKKEKN